MSTPARLRLSRSLLGAVMLLGGVQPGVGLAESKHTAAKTAPQGGKTVEAVRCWSQANVTRVAIEASAEVEFRSERLHTPERLVFDIVGFQPRRPFERVKVGDARLRQIRVAETAPGTTRIVLDLTEEWEYTTTKLSNPDRLVIEIRGDARGPRPEVEPPLLSSASAKPLAAKPAPAPELWSKRGPAPAMASAEPKPYTPPAAVTVAATRPAPNVAIEPPAVEIAAAARTATAPTLRQETLRAELPRETRPAGAKAKSAVIPAMPTRTERGEMAKRDSSGSRSLTRALGLKLGRVVLDAGHGGHDTGTLGVTGLAEKDLVLDVSNRLGALIQERLGSEVIYTRSDDTFIALEERTMLANAQRADLFLSIHANSSPQKSASGVETYYLNFATSRDAMEVAARENAGAQRGVHELRDLVQKIALQEKMEESREFAAKVQGALYGQAMKANPRAKDRGVKKAPFVVLIGAAMPSVLAEIGFVSNPKDEANMKKPEFRQKLAEALYKGVAAYAASLSHFQVAQRAGL